MTMNLRVQGISLRDNYVKKGLVKQKYDGYR